MPSCSPSEKLGLENKFGQRAAFHRNRLHFPTPAISPRRYPRTLFKFHRKLALGIVIQVPSDGFQRLFVYFKRHTASSVF